MEPEVFVTTADLSARRSPPNQQTGLREFLQHPQILKGATVAYFLVVFILWPTLRNEVFYPLGLLSDASSNWATGVALGFTVSLPFVVGVVYRGMRDQYRLRIPFYRNLIFVRDITQVAMLIVLLGGVYTLIQNLTDNFQQGESGLVINFNALERDYPVAITEGPDYKKEIAWIEDVPALGDTLNQYLRSGTYTRAMLTGLSNTLRAVLVGLVFTTMLGVFVGIGLLSNNWLVRKVSSVYVEIFRNTPLLVQLFFIYNAMRLFPDPLEAYHLPASIYVSKRGINYPKIIETDSFNWLLGFVVISLVLGVGLWVWRLRVQDQTGKPAYGLTIFGLVLLVGVGLGLSTASVIGGTFPLDAELPLAERFNFKRGVGSVLTPEFFALVLSLVLYTGAFIADIVRAGIQSVPKGQLEAARASGLTNAQTLRLVVLPQAMRLIIPPMTNQYLNLSKNSSLAISIGYFDLFNVGTIAANQSGQVIVFFAVIMVTYLLISLIIAFLMNIANRALHIKTR